MFHALVVLTVVAGGAANPFLKEAVERYEHFQYTECLQRLAQARQWPSTPAELLTTEVYAGLCAASMGDAESATRAFRLALDADATVTLPPYTSPKIVALFERARPPTAPEPPRPPSLEPAPRVAPPVVVKPARWARWVPIGGLTASALITFSVGVWFGLGAQRLEREANASVYDADRARLGAGAQSSAVTANVMYGVAAGCLLSAVVVYLLTIGQPSGSTTN